MTKNEEEQLAARDQVLDQLLGLQRRGQDGKNSAIGALKAVRSFVFENMGPGYNIEAEVELDDLAQYLRGLK